MSDVDEDRLLGIGDDSMEVDQEEEEALLSKHQVKKKNQEKRRANRKKRHERRKESAMKGSESEDEDSLGVTGRRILESLRAGSTEKANAAEEGKIRSWGSEEELAQTSLQSQLEGCESRQETHMQS